MLSFAKTLNMLKMSNVDFDQFLGSTEVLSILEGARVWFQTWGQIILHKGPLWISMKNSKIGTS